MTTETDIDDLLRQDEAELKAKRRRLKTFAAALEDSRRANDAAARGVNELLAAGDLSRADLGRVFQLTKSEKLALIPARRTGAPNTPNTVEDNTTDRKD